MSWKIIFYSAKVADAIDEWPARMQAKFLWILDLIKKSGPVAVGMPHVKSLGQGLFEIRVKSAEGIARALFCIQEHKIVMILSEFIKKTQKTPPREIELAIKRMKEVKKYD